MDGGRLPVKLLTATSRTRAHRDSDFNHVTEGDPDRDRNTRRVAAGPGSP